jgi:uncharacterized protein YecT (DUF1311 family)
MRVLIFTLTLTVGFSTHAQVDNPDALAKKANPEIAAIKKQEAKCFEKAESNFDMKMCASKTHDAADKLLNKTYQRIIAKLDQQIAQEKKDKLDDYAASGQETKSRLIAVQRAWVSYRDAVCVFEGLEMLHGTGEGLVIGNCLSRLTIARAAELIDILDPEM